MQALLTPGFQGVTTPTVQAPLDLLGRLPELGPAVLPVSLPSLHQQADLARGNGRDLQFPDRSWPALSCLALPPLWLKGQLT